MRWLLVLALACGGTSREHPIANQAPAGRPPRTAPTCTEYEAPCVLARIEHVAETICACKLKSCAKRALRTYVDWSTSHSGKNYSPHYTKEQRKRMSELSTTYNDCYTKLAGRELP
jgi:hypothetical protein